MKSKHDMLGEYKGARKMLRRATVTYLIEPDAFNKQLLDMAERLFLAKDDALSAAGVIRCPF